MAEVTLRDILIILTDQIKVVRDKQEVLAANQEELVDATNHKIDILKKQGITAFVASGVVLAPMIAFNWVHLVSRIKEFFF